MENRSTLRFVVGTLSGQPDQRRQGARSGYSPCDQPRWHSTADGSHDSTEKPDVSRRAVPTLAQQAGCPESHHGHGSPARPTGLSNAEVWSTVRRQRCRVLRATKPPTTNRVPQKEGSATRPTSHTSQPLNLSTSKFLGRGLQNGKRQSKKHRTAYSLVQTKLEASSVLPAPLYFATVGTSSGFALPQPHLMLLSSRSISQTSRVCYIRKPSMLSPWLWGAPVGTFFDLALVHLLTTATL